MAQSNPDADTLSSSFEPRQCRICLDVDQEANLISPCHCKGSIAFVHVDCFKAYRRVSRAGRLRCLTCNYPYSLLPSRRNRFIKCIDPILRASSYLIIFLLAFLLSYLNRVAIGSTMDSAVDLNPLAVVCAVWRCLLCIASGWGHGCQNHSPLVIFVTAIRLIHYISMSSLIWGHIESLGDYLLWKWEDEGEVFDALQPAT